MRDRELQYDYLWDQQATVGKQSLGVMSSETWRRDPKRLGFVLARYKFVSKMLSGKSRVLEVGCGDGWASKIVQQEVAELFLSDFDQKFLHEASQFISDKNKILHHDFIKSPTSEPKFNAIYLLDVFEHIPLDYESDFIGNLVASLEAEGILIIGSPSIESQAHIPIEKRDPGHVNCKGGSELKNLMEYYFENVFLFGMNDETLLTSPSHMCFYNIVLCTNRK